VQGDIFDNLKQLNESVMASDEEQKESALEQFVIAKSGLERS